MRDIKFRAWDKNIKYMDEIDGHSLYLADGKVYEVSEGSHGYDVCMDKEDVSDRYVPMQYTGVKDRNGKEIYEGDILKYRTILAEIIYGFCGFEFRWIDRNVAITRGTESEEIFQNVSLIFDVVGNIYENPELL